MHPENFFSILVLVVTFKSISQVCSKEQPIVWKMVLVTNFSKVGSFLSSLCPPLSSHSMARTGFTLVCTSVPVFQELALINISLFSSNSSCVKQVLLSASSYRWGRLQKVPWWLWVSAMESWAQVWMPAKLIWIWHANTLRCVPPVLIHDSPLGNFSSVFWTVQYIVQGSTAIIWRLNWQRCKAGFLHASALLTL